jgi:hypothetical protein
MLRSEYQTKYIRLELPEQEQYKCFYCGEIATQTDHVPPVTHNEEFELGFLIPSCSECNCHLSNNRYETLQERTNEIKTYLKKEFNKILEYPDWSSEEIEEMTGRFKDSVVAIVETKKDALERISYCSSYMGLYGSLRLYEYSIIDFKKQKWVK